MSVYVCVYVSVCTYAWLCVYSVNLKIALLQLCVCVRVCVWVCVWVCCFPCRVDFYTHWVSYTHLYKYFIPIFNTLHFLSMHATWNHESCLSVSNWTSEGHSGIYEKNTVQRHWCVPSSGASFIKLAESTQHICVHTNEEMCVRQKQFQFIKPCVRLPACSPHLVLRSELVADLKAKTKSSTPCGSLGTGLPTPALNVRSP